MSSSTNVNDDFQADRGRLLNSYAWCGSFTDQAPYLEIRLYQMTLISGLAMQGDPYGRNYVNIFEIHVKETVAGEWIYKKVR